MSRMLSRAETHEIQRARIDQSQFSALAEPYRHELQAYCYRILGSVQDAEDLVQETMLRAWNRLDTFQGRAPFRAWLYKIATNACFDALDKTIRRTLPDKRQRSSQPQEPIGAAITEPAWLEPCPDDWLGEVIDTAISAEARYTIRESVTLAFLTALQVLPPRQRAVVILRDVLDWQASEVAPLLDLTVSAVNSALHRARVTLSKHYHVRDTRRAVDSLNDTLTRDLLTRYVRAWEEADVAGLVALLKEDATFSMPPSPSWYRGRSDIGWFFTSAVFANGMRSRLQPTRANGQPAFAGYVYDKSTQQYQAHALHLLTFESGQLSNLTTFLDPLLFPRFGLPNTLGMES